MLRHPRFRSAIIAVCLVLSDGTIALALPAAPQRLDVTAVSEQIQRLPGWTTNGLEISCTYQFSNFVESIAFVNQLVAPAEAMGHHPDLAVEYNKVTLILTTHDAGGLTQQDFALAETIAHLPMSQSLSCLPIGS
jgi:4a-hydroxytetrahydrobiopterin dehydratase